MITDREHRLHGQRRNEEGLLTQNSKTKGILSAGDPSETKANKRAGIKEQLEQIKDWG